MFTNARKMGAGSPQPSPAKLMNSQSMVSGTLNGRKNSFSQMMVAEMGKTGELGKI